jgi:drug/metabolite transporter (DMT)-like permease
MGISVLRSSRNIAEAYHQSSINADEELIQVQPPNAMMPSRRQQQLKKNEDKPILGTMYYLIYVALYSVNFLVVALLYARVGESLHAFQLLLGRSVWVILLTIVYYNWNLKKYTFDTIKGKSKTALTFRTLQSSISNIIKNWAPKYIPLTIISIIGNLGPMVTVVLAFFLLKEKLKRIELCVMIATLFCIVVVIVAGTD